MLVRNVLQVEKAVKVCRSVGCMGAVQRCGEAASEGKQAVLIKNILEAEKAVKVWRSVDCVGAVCGLYEDTEGQCQRASRVCWSRTFWRRRRHSRCVGMWLCKHVGHGAKGPAGWAGQKHSGGTAGVAAPAAHPHALMSPPSFPLNSLKQHMT